MAAKPNAAGGLKPEGGTRIHEIEEKPACSASIRPSLDPLHPKRPPRNRRRGSPLPYRSPSPSNDEDDADYRGSDEIDCTGTSGDQTDTNGQGRQLRL